MPLCPRCNNPFTCTCGSTTPTSFGSVAATCEEKPGQIWIHVTDDRGIDVPNVPTSGPTKSEKTNAEGTAIYQNVDPGPRTVALGTLTEELRADFEEFEGTRERPVTVAPGQIAYVPYQLFRKPALKVRVEKKAATKTPGKLFGGATVTTQGADTLTQTTQEPTGVADFSRVKAGEYAIKVALDPKDEEKFATKIEFKNQAAPLSLAQGQERVFVVEVEAINFVAGSAKIDKGTLYLDDDPNDDDSVGVVTLSLEQTNPDQKYTKEMWLECKGPDDVEASLKKDPWEPIAGSLKEGIKLEPNERDALRDEKTVTVYVRGKATEGDVEIALKLEEPGSRFVKRAEPQPPAKTKIEIVARPQFKILWMGTDAGVKDVVVSLGAETVPTSDDDGLAKWLTRGIKPGPYAPSFTFSDGVKYLLHDERGQPVDGEPKVDLAHRGTPFTFKIRKRNVTLQAMCEIGGMPAEAIDAKITVTHATELTLKKGDGATPVEVPIVEKDQKCIIQRLEPDVADVYEFVGVETR